MAKQKSLLGSKITKKKWLTQIRCHTLVRSMVHRDHFFLKNQEEEIPTENFIKKRKEEVRT
jgi:hypothetical protein